MQAKIAIVCNEQWVAALVWQYGECVQYSDNVGLNSGEHSAFTVFTNGRRQRSGKATTRREQAEATMRECKECKAIVSV